MSSIILPNSYNRQPPAATGVISAGNLSYGLVLAGHGSSSYFDVAKKDNWTNNSAIRASNPGGMAWSFNGSSSSLSRNSEAPLNTAGGQYTFMCLVTPRGLAADKMFFAFGSSTLDGPLVSLGTNGSTASTAAFRWRNDASAGLTSADVANELVNGKESLLIGVANATALTLYTRNGVGTATASGTATTNMSALGCWLRGLTSPTGGNLAQVDVSMWAAWSRALDSGEISLLLQNPWRIFVPQIKRFYVSAPAESSGFFNPYFYRQHIAGGMHGESA